MTAERTERLLHWGILAAFFVNALWVIWIPSFPTLDGWSHLHTARMLFDGPPEGVFCANPDIVPNRVGHLVLGLLTRVFAPLVAERVFLALLLFGIGGGAYGLMRAFGGRSPLILLVLPFTVNFMLVLGFHNYLLGMALAFAFAAWWVSRSACSWWTLAGHSIAAVILFYTHTTALVLYFMITGAHELSLMLGYHARAATGALGGRWKCPLLYVLSSMPALMLFSVFSAAHPNEWGAADQQNNLRELFNLRSLLLYHFEKEEKFLYALKVLLVACGSLAVVMRLREKEGRRLLHADVPLLVGAAMLVLYFILPDSAGYASYISVRTQWMALVLFIIGIALQRMPPAALVVPVVMLLLVHSARNGHISEHMAPLAGKRELLVDVARRLPAGSVVLPISTEDNWLLGHSASLLATERPLVLLDNYETTMDYFPLVLCPGLPSVIRDHIAAHDRCLGRLADHLEKGTAPTVDHIVIIGQSWDPSSCSAQSLNGPLARYFKPGYANEYVRVYERR
ncbi:MAG: hypothetical protein JNM62_12535 [Flavobacteriales bacterium]|nr:hypothetical protein [Flavobacteriales bacterium]